MSKHPNNSPEQKAAWQANKTLVSQRISWINAPDYRPEKKAQSRRDSIRAGFLTRKLSENRKMINGAKRAR